MKACSHAYDRPHIPEVYTRIGSNWHGRGERDVKHEANTALIRHLLSPRGCGSPHRTQLEFECGLRDYVTHHGAKHETRFDASPVSRKREVIGIPERMTSSRLPDLRLPGPQFFLGTTEEAAFPQGGSHQAVREEGDSEDIGIVRLGVGLNPM